MATVGSGLGSGVGVDTGKESVGVDACWAQPLSRHRQSVSTARPLSRFFLLLGVERFVFLISMKHLFHIVIGNA